MYLLPPSKKNIFIGSDFAKPDSGDMSVYTVMEIKNGIVRILESNLIRFSSRYVIDYNKEVEKFIENIKLKYPESTLIKQL